MRLLSDSERKELIALIEAGNPLPEKWRGRLFLGSGRTAEIGKEYRLVYDGKMRREEVLAQTPAAPWQLVRRFCAERPHPDGWRNLLVWGDNLLALRELLADQQGPNRFGTRDKIKLIYIDPPFATRQDFMKDKEKAYRDKVLGAQFIEFLRKRLILLRELLADDGSIVVHLDQKKGHYIKATLDEVFGETNFVNEIVWRRFSSTGSSKAISNKFPINHDGLFWYSKTDRYNYQRQYSKYSKVYLSRFKYDDQDGRGPYRISDLKSFSEKKLKELRDDGRVIEPKTSGAHYSYKRYLSELQGIVLDDVWTDIFAVNPMAEEKLEYPTQKPEELIERLIRALTPKDGIVLDAFAGSGTMAAVAEKLGIRWLAMDCGKLAIYTIQKRLFALTTTIGAAKKDDRSEPERVDDWAKHLKGAPSVLLITEKARKGECSITLDLLEDLAALVRKHDLIKKDAALSLACPKNKLEISPDKLGDTDEGPGTKKIKIKGVKFRISFVEPKEKAEKEKPLPAKEFALYRAGVYDMAAIKEMPWEEYRPFVLRLFTVREHPHKRYGLSSIFSLSIIRPVCK
jgi:DNA modification methylase